MSDDIRLKIKQTFEDSISVKEAILDRDLFNVLLEAGDVIAGSIADGGKALQYCNSAFIVPSKVTARIQESHITAGHAMLQYIEDKLVNEGWLSKEKN